MKAVLILAFILVASASCQAVDVQCSALFSEKKSAFSWTQFEYFKTKTVESLKSKSITAEEFVNAFEQEQSVEYKLALIEISALRIGKKSLATVLQEKNEDLDNELNTTLFKEMNLEAGLTPAQAKRLIVRVHQMFLEGNNRHFGFRIKQFFSRKGIADIIYLRFEKALLEQSFISLMQELGYYREPGILERIDSFRAKFGNIQSLVFSSALNAAVVAILGFPVHLPNLKLFNETNLKLDKFNAIYDTSSGGNRNFETIQNLFSANRMVLIGDHVLTVVKRLYSASMISFIMYMSVHNSLELRPEALEKFQEKTFCAETVRTQHIQAWKEAFYQFEGRWPQFEIGQKDYLEFKTFIDRLGSIPNEDLKAQF